METPRCAACECQPPTAKPRAIRLHAGSLPPLFESYQSRGLPEFEQLQPEYQELAAALQPHVDFFLCETMCTAAEAQAAGTAAADVGKPWWLSYTLEDSPRALLRSGEPLDGAIQAVAALRGLEAVLVNCCAPQAVTAAMPTLRAATPMHLQVGAYANGFQRTTSEWLGEGSSSQDIFRPPQDEYAADGVILPEAYAEHARRWMGLGATIIGGCCGVGPAHIAKVALLKNSLTSQGCRAEAAGQPSVRSMV